MHVYSTTPSSISKLHVEISYPYTWRPMYDPEKLKSCFFTQVWDCF